MNLFDDDPTPVVEPEVEASAVPEAIPSFALLAGEQEIIEFVRTNAITMNTLNSLSSFRASLVARAKRNDVVLKIGEDDAVYTALSDDQLIARIEDRNKIITASGKKTFDKPQVEVAPANVEATMSVDEIANHMKRGTLGSALKGGK